MVFKFWTISNYDNLKKRILPDIIQLDIINNEYHIDLDNDGK